jgi:AcrR family transcriptional regulator
VSTPPRYQRLNADERRDQLLDVANALVAERGYEEATIDAALSSGAPKPVGHG